MKKVGAWLVCLLALFSACSKEQAEKVILPSQGYWRAEIHTDSGQKIPFDFHLTPQTERQQWFISLLNHSEKIPLDQISYREDSLFVKLHIFDGELALKIHGKDSLEGFWIRDDFGKDKLRISAKLNPNYQQPFEKPIENQAISGKWEVTFTHNEKQKKAIGVFEQNQNQISGTFLSPTGDYRFLSGTFDANTNQGKLSCFDGAHAYLFQFTKKEDGSIAGDFFSGRNYHATWTAQLAPQASLPDPHTLTTLKDSKTPLTFSFPLPEGGMLTFPNPAYEGKVVIIQLLGTWCPNCMDETRYLKEIAHTFKDQVEIIGLAFEQSEQIEVAGPKIIRLKERLQVNYPIALAGVKDKEKASSALPMLSSVYAYPTTIYVDKKGNIARIHTGFNGPATGKLYQDFVEQNNLFIQDLIR